MSASRTEPALFYGTKVCTSSPSSRTSIASWQQQCHNLFFMYTAFGTVHQASIPESLKIPDGLVKDATKFKMATTIILTNPPDYDLQALAEVTRQSLALLKPWTLLDTTNDPSAAQIVSQAAKYVSAIQLGVSAAYSGFAVTEKVLFLASALPIEDKDDLLDYLVGMMDLAREGRENAYKAYQAFRNVRQETFMNMNGLQEDNFSSQDESTEGSSSTYRRFPEHTLDGIEVLVKFSESISRFANWWDWVKIEIDPSCVKSQPILFQLDTLQDPGTVNRWTHFRGQYSTYVQLISELEDAAPSFFKRASSPDMRRASPAGLIEPTKTTTEGNDHIHDRPMVLEPESRSSSDDSIRPKKQEQKHRAGPDAATSVAPTNADVKTEKPKTRPLRKPFFGYIIIVRHRRYLIKYIKKTLQHKQKDATNIPQNLWRAGWTKIIDKPRDPYGATTRVPQHALQHPVNDSLSILSATTIYSDAYSSEETVYGFYYTRRALDSSCSLQSQGSHSTLHC